MPSIEIRPFEEGDGAALQTVLGTCFHGIERWSLERIKRLTSSTDFEPKNLLLAVSQAMVVGCVRIVRLPRGDAYVVRDLAALSPYNADEIAGNLLESALLQLEGLEPTFIRARTPILEPYVSAYRRRGFAPVRRVLTMSWDLTVPAPMMKSAVAVKITERKVHGAKVLAELYLIGLSPYWDWWIADRGGPSALLSVLTEHFQSIPDQETWLVAELEGNPVGLSGASPSTSEEVVLEGVYVLPEFRGKGIGSTLMSATLAELRRVGQSKLVVYDTFSDLESYAPAVGLYLKSGGRIEAEYLHLERW